MVTKEQIHQLSKDEKLSDEVLREYLDTTYADPKVAARTVKKYQEIVSNAMTDLIFEFEIIGYTALNIGGVEVISDLNHLAVGYTNFKKIYVNALYADTFDLTKEHIRFLIAHEVFHTILLTKARYTKDKYPRLWNKAADYAINSTLIDDEEVVKGKTVGKFIEFGCYDAKYRRMSAEEIYKELLEEIKQQQKEEQDERTRQNQSNTQDNSSSEDSGFGDSDSIPQDSNGNDSESSSDNQQSNGNGQDDNESENKGFTLDIHLDPNDPKNKEAIDEAILRTIQILETAQAQGKLSAGLKRFIDSIPKDVKQDWRSILNNYLQSFKKAESSWKRPNKRYMANEFYFPNRYNTPNLTVAIGIDTSGSINNKVLGLFFAHIFKILKSYKTFNVKIFCWSERVHKDTLIEYDEKTFKNFKLEDYTIKSFGGTDITDTIDYISKLKDVDVSVVLTDGYFSKPTQILNKPIVFGIIDNDSFTAPSNLKRCKVLYLKD